MSYVDNQQQLHAVPKVAVVMSTYNGEDYLADQIDSVLAQDVPDVHLFVRDDGSTDASVAILRAYEAKGLLTLRVGENKGVVGSFLEALAMPPHTYEFVAFCDQDDVWHTDKISRALATLMPRDQSIPQLYCTEYNFCDQELKVQKRSSLNRIGVSFSLALFEDVVSGNTSVMNRVLADELLANATEGVYTHDWWMELLALGLGELSFDKEPSLEYRRLVSSVSPTGGGGLALVFYRLRTFLGKGQLSDIVRQLRHYRERYGERLKPKDHALLCRMLDGSRIAKACVPVRLRQKMSDELALRVAFLFGLL